MGDDLDDLRAVVSEQGLALAGLQQAAADAEERQKSSHAELLEMMAVLLKTSRESGPQEESGGEQRLPTADTAGRDAVSPSLDRSDDGTGSRKEERGGAAEAGLTGGQLGGREQVWGVGPSGELSITAAGLPSWPFLGQPKMAIPVLRGVSGARLRATTATVAPQSSAKGVVGEDTRAASAHRRRTWTDRRRRPCWRWWRFPEMMRWRRRRFRGTAAKAPRWEYNRGRPRRT
jgi:hypothetical protein